MTPEELRRHDVILCVAWEIRGLNRAMDIMSEHHDKMMNELALLIESKEQVMDEIADGADDE